MTPGLNALVVEDNPHMRLLLTEILRGLGARQVAAVASVSQAREVLDRKAYDVALVDVALENENGLDLIQGVRRNRRSRHRRMPMLVISGQGQRTVIEAARDAGADGFVLKPISAGQLGAKLNQLLAAPQTYVDADTYFGPDRRRRPDPAYRGQERRGGGSTIELD